MIVNSDLLQPDDELRWTFRREEKMSLLNMAKRLFRSRRVLLTFVVTTECINKCVEARALIKKWHKIPDLGEFVPQRQPDRGVDTSKFLIELQES